MFHIKPLSELVHTFNTSLSCLKSPVKFEPWHDKTNKMTVHPAKTQISLGIRPVWSESSLCAQWVAKDPSFLHADSEDADDQTGWMFRLIWVFAGCTVILLVLSCRGSFKLQSGQKFTTCFIHEHFFFCLIKLWQAVSFISRALYSQFIDEMIIKPGVEAFESGGIADVTFDDHVLLLSQTSLFQQLIHLMVLQ